jgi:hypothetical protein
MDGSNRTLSLADEVLRHKVLRFEAVYGPPKTAAPAQAWATHTLRARLMKDPMATTAP